MASAEWLLKSFISTEFFEFLIQKFMMFSICFKVKIKLQKNYIEYKKAETVSFIIGMVTESSMKYEKITYEL